MKISCLCCTYKRPRQLEEAIECFIRQTYPQNLRELIILDDAGQYSSNAIDLPGVVLVSINRRFMTLGEKHNAAAAMASPDTEAYAVWDDDDIYLPWHLETVAEVLNSGHKWFRPFSVWIENPLQLIKKEANGLFHGAWAFTRDALLQAGGYPACHPHHDQLLAGRFLHAGINSASERDIPENKYITLPGYIYRWYSFPGAAHVSADREMFDRLAQKEFEYIDVLTPKWTKDWVSVVEEHTKMLKND